MSATDELRRLLDERGVKWGDFSDEKCKHTDWNNLSCWFTEYPDGWTSWGMTKRGTPEQAIAATLGRGTCHIEERNGDLYCDVCGNEVGSFDPTSELFISGNAIELWEFCPRCGAKVVDKCSNSKTH